MYVIGYIIASPYQSTYDQVRQQVESGLYPTQRSQYTAPLSSGGLRYEPPISIVGTDYPRDLATNTPTRTPKVTEEFIQISIMYSYYYPPLGGVNCSTTGCGLAGIMANGEKWVDNVGRACACPTELPFGTIIIIDGFNWVCKDRGGMIVKVGKYYWIDFLTPYPQGGHFYGQELEVFAIIPEV